ncbi:phage antirepressor KilAC domain-containing protein [Microbulbifer sp. TRSA001]|uniref:phage antirepressor KilAC domain-containing protein n=1 Tax=Microbulbifer sp. TRSA001 TaxID=3243381 RepID=UPI004039AC48
MNNLIQIVDNQAITTSLIIAEGVQRPHKAVIQLLRQHVEDFEAFGRVEFEMRPFETLGGTQQREIAILNEHQATTLITFMRNIGVVKEFKKRLVKAFFEMRDELVQQRQAPSVENLSRMDILKMAIDSEQERLRLEQEKHQLEHQIEEEAPRVAFAKQVEIAPDAISVAQAAKILGTGQRRLFAFLRQIGWVSRRNEPYQAKIEAGCLDVKLGSWEHPNHGLQQSVTALVTGKGLTKLQRLWNQH